MQMREITEGVEIPPHATVTLAPGGYHVMFVGLKHPLVKGDTVQATLTFAHAGVVKVAMPVQPSAHRSGGGSRHARHEDVAGGLGAGGRPLRAFRIADEPVRRFRLCERAEPGGLGAGARALSAQDRAAAGRAGAGERARLARARHARPYRRRARRRFARRGWRRRRRSAASGWSGWRCWRRCSGWSCSRRRRWRASTAASGAALASLALVGHAAMQTGATGLAPPRQPRPPSDADGRLARRAAALPRQPARVHAQQPPRRGAGGDASLLDGRTLRRRRDLPYRRVGCRDDERRLALAGRYALSPGPRQQDAWCSRP